MREADQHPRDAVAPRSARALRRLGALALVAGLTGSGSVSAAVSASGSTSGSASVSAAALPSADTSPAPAPTAGITAPVGPGHRGGEQLDRTGVVLYDRSAGVPAPPAFAAGAYVVADLDSGDVVLAFNPHAQTLPASTLKALTALALVPRLEPETVVTATPEDAAIDGTKVGLDPGATYTVDQLFHALLMSSANDAAVALARVAGGLPETVDRMNAVAQEVGAVDTVAKNASGLDADGQVTTAYDLALIGRAALADPAIVRYATTKNIDFPSGRAAPGQARATYEVANHNRLLWNYDGALGLKNGYTVKARQTFIGAARQGDRAYVVTYLAGQTGGWRATADMLDWAFRYGPSLKPVGTLGAPGEQTPSPSGEAPPETAQGAPAADTAADTAVAVDASGSPEPEGGWDVGDAVRVGAGALVVLAGVVAALRLRAVRRRRARRAARARRRQARPSVRRVDDAQLDDAPRDDARHSGAADHY